MSNLNFVFCHGWGFDQHAMQPLAQALKQPFPNAQYHFFDLGFSAQSHRPELKNDVNSRYVLIGHSYGFAFLVQQSWPWSAMVSLNGFTHFCKLLNKAHGLPLAILDSTYHRLQIDAKATLYDFYQRCGLPAPYTSSCALGKAELSSTLLSLRELSISLPACPTLALACTHDQIVTPELTRESFISNEVQLNWLSGNHTSLLTNPDESVQIIARFVTQALCLTLI